MNKVIVDGIEYNKVYGYSNYYISKYGILICYKTLKNNKNKINFMKYEKSKSGYYRVGLTKNKIQIKFLVHRIVAETYIINNDNYKCVNHKDGNKLNNNIENLEWCSYSKNMIHSVNILKNNHSHLLGKTGYEHNCSKEVNQIDLNSNKIINTFGGIREAGRMLNISSGHISNVCNNKRKSCGGYGWSYN